MAYLLYCFLICLPSALFSDDRLKDGGDDKPVTYRGSNTGTESLLMKSKIVTRPALL